MQIRPSSALRNEYTQISELAKASGEPIFITNKGEDDGVYMSMAAYEEREKMFRHRDKIYAAELSRLSGEPVCTPEELETIKKYALKINEILTAFFAEVNIELIDFKLEFGRLSDGTIVLADEISPDTCRFWDSKTHEKLDKDRFRRDLGGVEDAYAEMMKRVGLD